MFFVYISILGFRCSEFILEKLVDVNLIRAEIGVLNLLGSAVLLLLYFRDFFAVGQIVEAIIDSLFS